jgi:hypothetical protein
MYQFTRFNISFKSFLPTVVNGLYIAYIDTDPLEQELPTTRDDLLRLVKSHQGARQGNLMENWSVSLPIRNDDQYFFIGNKGDVRFRKMGKLYIYQVGSATKFNGETIAETLDAGTLTMHWAVRFQSPQLQSLNRVYDGVTQKDVIRTFSNLSFYRQWSYTITSPAQLPGTKYRQVNQMLGSDLFHEGIGSYFIQKIPTLITIPVTVAAFHTLALPYSDQRYKFPGTDLHSMITGAITSAEHVSTFIEKAFKLIDGGIGVAKKVFDVISMISPLFAYNKELKRYVRLSSIKDSKTITIGPRIVPGTECIYKKSKNLHDIDEEFKTIYGDKEKYKTLMKELNNKKSIYKTTPSKKAFIDPTPDGGIVVYWDGRNTPLVQTLIEFDSNASAADPSTDVNFTQMLMAFKLDEANDSGQKVEPSLPTIQRF